ncbi:hypothetical protein RB195_014623 [Necator americanus]|uniref:SCP domain-containing protein n=1 Tax=Necator americanus TaxID=51031 RepID=A0ABR1E101_NECAM
MIKRKALRKDHQQYVCIKCRKKSIPLETREMQLFSAILITIFVGGNVARAELCPSDPFDDDDYGTKLMTEEIRRVFLSMHNNYRSVIARGEGVMKGGVQACPAAQMRRMEYDCDLEQHAGLRACIDPRFPRNRILYKNLSIAPATAARQAVETWYKEIESGTMLQDHNQENIYQENLNIPHFAKIVWDTNVYLGCSVTKCSSLKALAVVCSYDPSTFAVGQPIYEINLTCSRCKEVCDADGLCPSNWTSSTGTNKKA